MPPPPAQDPRRPARLAAFGPGARAAELAAAVAALAGAAGRSAHAFADVAELGELAAHVEVLVVDVDALAVEDLGYVKRFLAQQPRTELILIGDDPAARTARALTTLAARRWISWPPDLDAVRALGGAGEREPGTGPSRGTPPAPERPAARGAAPAGDEEMERVRAILDGNGEEEDLEDEGAAEAPAWPSRAVPESGELAVADATEQAPEVTALAATEGGAAPLAGGLLSGPAWLRSQVADLADTAQRIDLSLRALAEAVADADDGVDEAALEALRALEAEVARLVQFTRTLGYVVAPPPAGTQLFDLGEIVHLHAAALGASGPDAPRCQYRAQPARVRSDRQLLSQALDAFFFLVRAASGKGQLVRAQVRHAESRDVPRAQVLIEFPSGPLEGLAEREIVTPYALADVFPDLGPNALAAAAGIVAGQGGVARLHGAGAGRFEWRIELPLA